MSADDFTLNYTNNVIVHKNQCLFALFGFNW